MLGLCARVTQHSAQASFKYPSGVAVSPDGLRLFVADTNNHRIRSVTISSGVVATLAGSGTAQYADGTGTGVRIHTKINSDICQDVYHHLWISIIMRYTPIRIRIYKGMCASSIIGCMPTTLKIYI